MSESDDSDIAADIKALDEALAFNAICKPVLSPCDSSSTNANSDDSDDDYIVSNHDIDESQNTYEINKKLIRGLMIAKKKLTSLLQECELKIKQLDKEMNLQMDESSERMRLMITTAGIPYFKDKNCFSAPKNYDTKLKENRGELFLLNLPKSYRWSEKDRETLLRAIHHEAIESVLAGEFNKEIDERPKEQSSNSDNKARKISRVILPRNFIEMVGAIGEREFDWHKIAAMDFENKHSPVECRSMWNICLHPDIEKSEWTNIEDKNLLQCAKECKYQDWDTITAKLGTRRSAYQCFIRYNSIKKIPSSGHAWSKLEDKHLVLIINKLKIGDYIPWSEVTIYLQHRTKQQIYTRWMYRKAPHLIKGRFTYTETDTLFKAIRKHGKNFRKIARAVMPHRTPIQLYDHYHTIIASKNGNVWTIDDDRRLFYLHRRYGNDWSKIAMYFSSKSRTQVRHRHNALLKYIRKGFNLESIPRQIISLKNQTITSTSNESENYSKQVLQHIYTSEIIPRLYETLCFPPTARGINFQQLHDLKQITHYTKQLDNILNLLDANLDIPDDFFNYVHLNKREKQLLISLKQYINAKNNQTRNDELIEEFRWRMFGSIEKVSESSHFIPPLPFDGYIKKKNMKTTKSIDYDLDFSEKFLINIPMEIVTPCEISSFFVDIEEEIQFRKLGQLLISDNQNKRHINLHQSLGSKFFSNEKNVQLEHDKQNINLKVRLEHTTEVKQSSRLKESTSTEYISNKEVDILRNLILPNHATLIGLKNLLLWKLLYDHQYEPHLTLQSTQQSKEKESLEYRKAYQKLKIRLLRLFKLPIALSNTTLQIYGSEMVFSIRDQDEHALMKMNSECQTKQNRKRKVEIPAVSNIQQNTYVKTAEHPIVRSCKVICKKYKIVAK